MVPKDELLRIHKKIIQTPLRLVIQKNLSISKEHLESYLKKFDIWFESIESEVIDKKRFVAFLNFIKDNTLDLFSKIDTGLKINVKSILNEFLKELEEHCNYFLKLKLKYVIDSINDENESGANLKHLGRILVPIIILSFILIMIIGGLYLIIGFTSNSDGDFNSNFNENSSQSLNQDDNLSLNLSSYDGVGDEGVIDSNIDNIDNNHKVDNDSDVESFQLSQVEKELLDLINNQRVKYYKSELLLNLNLSALLRNHTYEMSKSYEITNEDKYGGMGDRTLLVNVTVPVRESNSYYQYSSGVLSDMLFEKVKNDNLFLNKNTYIAIGITEGEYNTYFVTIDTY